VDAFTAFVTAHEPALRLAGFAAVLFLMAALEAARPRRPGAQRAGRWPANLGVVVIDALTVRGLAFLLPLLLPVAAAAWAAERGWGLLPVLGVEGWAALVIAVLALDLAIYGQHVAFHKVPLLWRLHRMHHSDMAIDTTTGLRFHPIEIVISILIKVVLVVALGAPAAAVVVFEVLLNATSLFNHANVALPGRLDRALRLVLVTPDMHRVHHSVHRDETDSNFGFNVPWWDRLFGTYRAQPRDGHAGMTIGVSELRDPARQGLLGLLAQPFRKP